MLWRVGDGRNIGQEYHLIPGYQEALPVRGTHLITRVWNMIDPITNSWDTQLVKQIFIAEDAKIIMQIPIQNQNSDVIGWHFDKKGRF